MADPPLPSQPVSDSTLHLAHAPGLREHVELGSPIGSDSATPISSAPPPSYAPSLPQILITPLPESASFFWGRTVQGEVFVKGLGDLVPSSGARTGNSDAALSVRLNIRLYLTDSLPGARDVMLHRFPVYQLWPSNSASSSASASGSTTRFPGVHRFSIPLPAPELLDYYTSSLPPPASPTAPSSSSSATPTLVPVLPGSLDLAAYSKGSVSYNLRATLVLPPSLLPGGAEVSESIQVDGTPPEVASFLSDPVHSEGNKEVRQALERNLVRVRALLHTASPRVGDLLRLGVEVGPIWSEKTSRVPTLAADTLRPLRRVRVELFRRVLLTGPPHIGAAASSGSRLADPKASNDASSPTSPTSVSRQHLTLMYASGKSLRFPGSSASATAPPLRLIFTLPTTPPLSDQTGGEISQVTAYHTVSFFVRITIGFGSGAPGVGPSQAASSPTRIGSGDGGDWTIETPIVIRPRLWHEPNEGIMERGAMPEPGDGSSDGGDSDIDAPYGAGEGGGGGGHGTSDAGRADRAELDAQRQAEQLAYRLKGRDVVGSDGTWRADDSGNQAGPSLPSFESGRQGQLEGLRGQPDEPPPFASTPAYPGVDTAASPSHLLATLPGNSPASALPTFTESEAQMRAGSVPLVAKAPKTAKLQVVQDAETWSGPPAPDDGGARAQRSTEEQGRWVNAGRRGGGMDGQDGEDDTQRVGPPRGGLGGELGTWIEYDGYETFSSPPPSVSASFGVGGSMDPPQEGEEEGHGEAMVSGVMARLGLAAADPVSGTGGDGVVRQMGSGVQGGTRGRGGGMELMERLGLGEGTRVIDLQDDLPPGIDEPSLPALPSFSSSTTSSRRNTHSLPVHPAFGLDLAMPSGSTPPPDFSPPSISPSDPLIPLAASGAHGHGHAHPLQGLSRTPDNEPEEVLIDTAHPHARAHAHVHAHAMPEDAGEPPSFAASEAAQAVGAAAVSGISGAGAAIGGGGTGGRSRSATGASQRHGHGHGLVHPPPGRTEQARRGEAPPGYAPREHGMQQPRRGEGGAQGDGDGDTDGRPPAYS